MSEMAPETEAPALPVPVSTGIYALYNLPDGSMVIAYEAAGTDKSEQVAIPAELVPALHMLRANPAALMNISQSPAGGMARAMVRNMIKKTGNGSVG